MRRLPRLARLEELRTALEAAVRVTREPAVNKTLEHLAAAKPDRPHGGHGGLSVPRRPAGAARRPSPSGIPMQVRPYRSVAGQEADGDIRDMKRGIAMRFGDCVGELLNMVEMQQC